MENESHQNTIESQLEEIAELQEIKNQFDTMEQQIRAKVQKSIDAMHDELQSKTKELSSANNQIEDLLAMIKQYETQIENSSNSRDQQLKDKMNDVMKLTRENQQLQRDIAALNDKLQDQQRSSVNLSKQLEETMKLQEEIERLKALLNNSKDVNSFMRQLQMQVSQKDSQIKELQRQNQQMQAMMQIQKKQKEASPDRTSNKDNKSFVQNGEIIPIEADPSIEMFGVVKEKTRKAKEVKEVKTKAFKPKKQQEGGDQDQEGGSGTQEEIQSEISKSESKSQFEKTDNTKSKSKIDKSEKSQKYEQSQSENKTDKKSKMIAGKKPPKKDDESKQKKKGEMSPLPEIEVKVEQDEISEASSSDRFDTEIIETLQRELKEQKEIKEELKLALEEQTNLAKEREETIQDLIQQVLQLQKQIANINKTMLKKDMSASQAKLQGLSNPSYSDNSKVSMSNVKMDQAARDRAESIISSMRSSVQSKTSLIESTDETVSSDEESIEDTAQSTTELKTKKTKKSKKTKQSTDSSFADATKKSKSPTKSKAKSPTKDRSPSKEKSPSKKDSPTKVSQKDLPKRSFTTNLADFTDDEKHKLEKPLKQLSKIKDKLDKVEKDDLIRQRHSESPNKKPDLEPLEQPKQSIKPNQSKSKLVSNLSRTSMNVTSQQNMPKQLTAEEKMKQLEAEKQILAMSQHVVFQKAADTPTEHKDIQTEELVFRSIGFQITPPQDAQLQGNSRRTSRIDSSSSDRFSKLEKLQSLKDAVQNAFARTGSGKTEGKNAKSLEQQMADKLEKSTNPEGPKPSVEKNDKIIYANQNFDNQLRVDLQRLEDENELMGEKLNQTNVELLEANDQINDLKKAIKQAEVFKEKIKDTHIEIEKVFEDKRVKNYIQNMVQLQNSYESRVKELENQLKALQDAQMAVNLLQKNVNAPPNVKQQLQQQVQQIHENLKINPEEGEIPKDLTLSIGMDGAKASVLKTKKLNHADAFKRAMKSSILDDKEAEKRTIALSEAQQLSETHERLFVMGAIIKEKIQRARKEFQLQETAINMRYLASLRVLAPEVQEMYDNRNNTILQENFEMSKSDNISPVQNQVQLSIVDVQPFDDSYLNLRKTKQEPEQMQLPSLKISKAYPIKGEQNYVNTIDLKAEKVVTHNTSRQKQKLNDESAYLEMVSPTAQSQARSRDLIRIRFVEE
ncbi:Conserved_hypothetical protein [Hexamita inflata]|uniref:Uncharacterized protein n=1 Tax=Hexamita inflata TaxID=28002 RepID=A0AA86TJB6_9EUKA|nr:Conserved hypothetical protein [Hexamita inflata]